MITTPPHQLSSQALLSQAKALKTLTRKLAAVLLVLLAIGSLLALKQGANSLLGLPVVLLPALLMNRTTLNALERELKTRQAPGFTASSGGSVARRQL